jgi:hypothetical protein
MLSQPEGANIAYKIMEEGIYARVASMSFFLIIKKYVVRRFNESSK